MREVIKHLLKKLPVAFTQNQRYDRDAQRLLKLVCSSNSNCVDVGCHAGEFTDWFLKYAPQGQHFAFEPIPQMFTALVTKYEGTSIVVSAFALSNEVSTVAFNHVVSNPAYSGLRKRSYDRPVEQDQTIEVKTNRLDNIIPSDCSIAFIKIDVEGAELGVLEGAIATIVRCKPFIIFEHGLGASDHYGTTPDKVWHLLTSCGLRISSIKGYLSGHAPFDQDNFSEQFYKKKNYYFLAYA
jgi:FkbM family methyltransferase